MGARADWMRGLCLLAAAGSSNAETSDSDEALFREAAEVCTAQKKKIDALPAAVSRMCPSQDGAALLSLRFGELMRRLERPGELQKCLAKEDPARCLSLMHLHNELLLRESEMARVLASAALPGTALVDLAERQLHEARLATFRSATRKAVYSPQYGFYLGPSLSLEADGSWATGVEAMSRFLTEACPAGRVLGVCRGERWWRGYAEVSYQTIGMLDDAADAARGALDDMLQQPTQPVPELEQNPFIEPGGFFRLNLGLRYHFMAWGGLQSVAGVSSLPNSNEGTALEPRHSHGLYFQTFFGDGAVGELFMGYAHDEFWQREVYRDPANPAAGTRIENSYDRVVVEGTFLPSARVDSFHFVLRLFADVPANGEGPSDVRLSALLYYDVSGWLKAFRALSNPLGLSLPQPPL